MGTIAKIFGLLMAAAFIAAEVLLVCGPRTAAVPQAPPPTVTGGFPMEVNGDDGRPLRLAAPPSRIVSLSPGHTEVLFAIGAGPQVVAADEFSDYPAEAKALPKVTYTNVNLEQLVALRPDLVIAVTHQRAALPEMQKLGLPVLYLSEAGTINGILDRVRALGRVTGRAEAAEALAVQTRQRLDAVTARLAAVPQGPTVFYELSPEYHTAGPKSFIGDMLAQLRLRNIAAGIENPFPKLSPEKILADDPDIIFIADPEAGVTVQSVAERPGWGALRAVRQRRVFVVPDRDVAHRPGPRVVEGIEALARLAYPELYR